MKRFKEREKREEREEKRERRERRERREEREERREREEREESQWTANETCVLGLVKRGQLRGVCKDGEDSGCVTTHQPRYGRV